MASENVVVPVPEQKIPKQKKKIRPIDKLKFREMRRVYVYSLPVRIYHWLNALAIVVLAATGYLIGNPPAFMTNIEASDGYWFGTTRFLHFSAGYIFLVLFVVRVYFMFAGNRFERWYNFIPYKKSSWKEAWKVVKHDLLFVDNTPMVTIGHNALAGLTYFILFALMLAQIITGLGLYEPMSNSWFAGLFSWVVPFFGGDGVVRLWHHIFMWVFIIFTMLHVYLVFFHDYVEGRGETSSMVGGWKFIEKHLVDNKQTTDFKE